MTINYKPDAPRFYGILTVVCAIVSVWHGYDGWVAQERWLERYPEFPAAWYDFGLYEFYAYNRWTAVIFGIITVVCAVVSVHSYWTLKKQDDLLDTVTEMRRARKS